MPARRRIDPADGASAVRAWAATRHPDGAAPDMSTGKVTGMGAGEGAAVDRRTLATAVRYTLEELTACAPGRSVEVRVPPFGATQAVAGTTHRRGTPPSVVETDAATWLALATGRLGWAEATDSGALAASGERCDLSPYLPLMRA